MREPSHPPVAAHGGDAAEVAQRRGLDPGDLLDFSANINPAGPPPGVLERLAGDAADVPLLARYPDPNSGRLRAAIAERLGVVQDSIVVGNGAAALIGAVVRASGPGACLLPVPAFGEYRHALSAAGRRVVTHPLDPGRGFVADGEALRGELGRERLSLCLLANPNNPSGALVPREAVLELAAAAHATGTLLVVDEAFVDYVPEAGVTREAASTPGLVSIRSLTKFYGMPALRVGYAVASPAVAGAVRRQMDAWPVTALAENAAVEALADEAYESRSRSANDSARARLVAALGEIPGLRVYPSSANFLLVELVRPGLRADRVRERLIARHRILVRDGSSYEGLRPNAFLRCAVRGPGENARLAGALRAVVSHELHWIETAGRFVDPKEQRRRE